MAETTPPVEAPQPKDVGHGRRHTILEYVLITAGAIVLALLIQAFVVKPYKIPSASMSPTLEVGDRVLVNRLAYHLRQPHRGDIIVFNSPTLHMTLIKRIIGLPGDTISLHDGLVYINGKRLNEPYLRQANGSYTPTVPAVTSGPPQPWSLDRPYTVPAGQYFVMGDNRTDSDDSRYWGPVSRSDLIGVAFFRYWPLNRLAGL